MAQRVHGATFTVEAAFRAPVLDEFQVIVDMGLATTELRCVLDTLDYSNLDENPLLRQVNTTTEYLAFRVHGLPAAACRDGRLGSGGRAVASVRVLLRESPTAWAVYEAPINDNSDQRSLERG